MTHTKTIGLIGTATVFLSACSTSNTGPSQTTYETFLSNAASTSNLTGAVHQFQTGTAYDPTVFTAATGTLNHGTKAVTILSLTDSDGADNNGDLVDDTNPAITGTLLTGPQTSVNGVGNGYGYVQPILINDPSGGPNVRSFGYAGFATAAADIPTTGSATYNGTAGGNAPGGDWDTVPVTLTANFLAGTVGLTGQNTVFSGEVVALDITGATISGGTFSGGTATATADGTPIDISSQIAPAFAGQFFGYNDNDNVPGDVGALFGSKGATHTFDLVILGTTITPSLSN